MTYPLFHWSSDTEPPMVLSEEDFKAAFPGEDDYVERKQGVSRDRIREAVTAFSNAEGGVILIGVANDGTIVGHDLDGESSADLHRIVYEVHNPARYDLRSISVGDERVTVLAVDRRREGFAQTPDSAVLVRRGASNARLIGAELASFISDRRLDRFESTPTDVTLEQVNDEFLRSLAAAWGWDPTDPAQLSARLVEHGLAANTRHGICLTVAGTLYLLSDPNTVLGKPMIEIFRYPEQSKNYDKRTPVQGPINHQVAEATNTVMEELGAELVVLGLRRYELERIPRTVLREAIANAVAHRDYENTGTATRIEIRPESVRIISPGGLPEPVTVANIREQQAARNLAVIDTLRRFRLAEDAGRGVDLMQDSMLANMLQPPEFTDSGRALSVELRIGSSVAPAERAWVRELEQRGDIGPNERRVLVHAARGEVLTNRSVRDLLGVDSVDARALLQGLRDADFLVQVGSRGGAVYNLAGDLAPPAGLRLGPDELADLVEELAREGPVTNEIVRNHTGLDRAGAVRLLGTLVKEGRLRKIGSRRGAHYVPADENGEELPLS